MVKKFITLGEINKKHLLPLFLAIYQIINKFFNKYYPKKKRKCYSHYIFKIFRYDVDIIYSMYI